MATAGVPVGYDPGQSLLAGGSGHLEAMRGGGWRGGAGETFDEYTANRIYGKISKVIKPQEGDENDADYETRITIPLTSSPTLQTAQQEGRLPPEGINHIVQALIAIAAVKEGDDIDTFVGKIRQVIDDGAISEKPEGDGKYTTKNSISGGTGTDPSKTLQAIGDVASFLKIKKSSEDGAGAGAGAAAAAAPAAPRANEPVPEAAAPAPAAPEVAAPAAEAEAAPAPEAAAPAAAAETTAEPEAETETETVTYFGKEVPKNVIERLKAWAPIEAPAGSEKEEQAQFFSAIRNLLIDVQGRKDASRGVITIEIPTNVPVSGTGGAGAGAGTGIPAKRTGGSRSRKTRRRNKPLRKARTRRHH